MAQAENSNEDRPYRRSLLARQRSRDTRAAIVRAAAEVWGQRGFDETTIDDICEVAGVARSTFYVHFESKDQLLGELTWATAGATASEIEPILEAGDMDQQIDAFIDGLTRRMMSVPRDLAALLLRKAIGGVEQLGQFPDDRVDFGLILARILEHAKVGGIVHPDVDADEIGAIIGAMTMEALLRWSTGHTGTTPLRDSLALRFDLVLDGLRI
jgi:AcrR family transcriptional regulator